MTTPDDPEPPDGAEGPAATPVDPAPRGRRRARRRPDAPTRVPGLFSPRPRWEKSPAALVGLVAFLWGMSLLMQEWLRTTWFEPRGLSSSLLAAPFFAAAFTSALIAMRARAAGRPALGGPPVHRFGIASGLVGATALVLALYMGPRLLALQESARLARARAQLQDIAVALEARYRSSGAYPEGAGAATLEDLGGGFTSRGALRDPWGHELEYRSLASGRGYLLLTLGRDGVADVPLTDYLDEGRRQVAGNDIVMVNGVFLDDPASADAFRAPRREEQPALPALRDAPAQASIEPPPAATAPPASAGTPATSAPVLATAPPATAPRAVNARPASPPRSPVTMPAAAPITATAPGPAATAPPTLPAPSAPRPPVNRPSGPAESP